MFGLYIYIFIIYIYIVLLKITIAKQKNKNRLSPARNDPLSQLRSRETDDLFSR